MLPSGNRKAETARLTALGISHFVLKPVKRNELLGAVAAAAARRAAIAALPVLSDARPRQGTLLPQYRLRILFADDSADNRALIKAYMKNTNHLVDFAENGKEAISKFIAGCYDMVFMDIQMPIVDGYTAVAEIRQWENHMCRRPTPIVALTASADLEAVRRTQEAGCNLHVSKPLKKVTLLEAITRCVPPPQAAVTPDHRGHQVA